MENIYYHPEHYELEVLETIDRPDMSYEFDTFAIWISRKDRKVYYATDSGCSCPTPFESISSVEDLSEIRDLKAFENDLRSWGTFIDAYELQKIIDKVRVAMLYKCMLT